MDVVFLAPAYPGEMPLFTRGLAEAGARVIGVGDQPLGSVPETAKRAMSDYVQITSWADEDAVVATVLGAVRGRNVDLVETLWEPTVLLAARLREAIGAPGLTVEQTVPFRDKGRMKEVVDAAGIRTPRSARATTVAGCREAVEQIGYPAIIKPIAGAGSLDTYRIESEADLEAALPRLRHIDEVSVEEFIDGEEFTYDTVCSAGTISFYNIAEYRPRPLVGKQVEWISQQVIAHRDPDHPSLAGGKAMGEAVIAAMGFGSGFTHMEWYLTEGGEVVFGEIGARAPGAPAHRPDELQLRHRPLRRVGGGGVLRPLQPAGGAALQRGDGDQAGPGSGADHPRRRTGAPDGHDGRAHRQHRPRRRRPAAAGLAGHRALRRDRRRAPSRPGDDLRARRPHRHRAPRLRRLSSPPRSRRRLAIGPTGPILNDGIR